ncbi:MAG: hypothetical protein JOZ54_19300, partial [Acidobacteria bacterium]|nr:hypothetical protein [Acidobacteriota bacterium]
MLLDPIEKIVSQGRGSGAYWIVRLPDGRKASLYPIVAPVLLAPVYLPAIAVLNARGGTDAQLDYVARVMEKLTASCLAAASVSLLYLLLKRRTTHAVALWLAIAYAFGTTTWVVSSQALWQHGLAGLLVIGALLCLTAQPTASRALAAGLLCGLLAANRPPDVILAAALLIHGLTWAARWSRAIPLAVGVAVPTLLVLSYNLGTFGYVTGGYQAMNNGPFFEHDLFEGIAGLLVSPTRGLLVFSPFLLFLALAWRHRPTDRAERRLTVAMAVAVVLQILLYAKTDWRGGISWGPRYMTDLLPFLLWMLVPVVAALRGLGKRSFQLAVGVAIVIEAIGAFCYTGMSDVLIFASPRGPLEMRPAWNWRNTPFLASARRGPASADLLYRTRGRFDGVESAGGETFASGWALAGHATPWRIGVAIDGAEAVVSREFFERPDVRESTGEASRSGWRVPLRTEGLAPGEHQLTAFVWPTAESEGRYLGEWKLIVESLGSRRPRTNHRRRIIHRPVSRAYLACNFERGEHAKWQIRGLRSSPAAARGLGRARRFGSRREGLTSSSPFTANPMARRTL